MAGLIVPLSGQRPYIFASTMFRNYGLSGKIGQLIRWRTTALGPRGRAWAVAGLAISREAKHCSNPITDEVEVGGRAFAVRGESPRSSSLNVRAQ